MIDIVVSAEISGDKNRMTLARLTHDYKVADLYFWGVTSRF